MRQKTAWFAFVVGALLVGATSCSSDSESNDAAVTTIATSPSSAVTAPTASTTTTNPPPVCDAWDQLIAAGPDSYPSDRGYPEEAAAASAQFYEEFGVALEQLLAVASDAIRPKAEELQTSLDALLNDHPENGPPNVIGMKSIEPDVQLLWIAVHKECPDSTYL